MSGNDVVEPVVCQPPFSMFVKNQPFKLSMANAVLSNTLHANNWKADSWKSLATELTQDVLNDAFSKHVLVTDLFKSVGTILPRKCKQMSRIAIKTDEVSKRGGEYFKVICDLVACRIHCEVHEIPNKIDMIRNIVKSKNGLMYVRGESDSNSYGFCMKDGKFTDITQYLYVYLYEIGYPVEVQIGHEFASYTFTIDSALRDNPGCGRVDLWQSGFYDDVKRYILSFANTEKSNVSYSAIVEKCLKIHQNRIPEDLNVILNKLNKC